MGTGFKGTFVISWAQTEIDGLGAAPLQSLTVGASWAWRGDVVRVDGPNGILQLAMSEEAELLRRRAARMVARLVSPSPETEGRAPIARRQADVADRPLMDESFAITDGRRCYSATLIDVGGGSRPLLMFLDEIPPQNRDLWVVRLNLRPVSGPAPAAGEGGVICFTTGTRIRTPGGPVRIERLVEGDLVQTRDDGAQPIRWIGRRRMSGARLVAMPWLRPVRIAAGVLGQGVPDADLLVSPQHRVLVRGGVARDLFNTPEVLVSARDLMTDAP